MGLTYPDLLIFCSCTPPHKARPVNTYFGPTCLQTEICWNPLHPVVLRSFSYSHWEFLIIPFWAAQYQGVTDVWRPRTIREGYQAAADPDPGVEGCVGHLCSEAKQ